MYCGTLYFSEAGLKLFFVIHVLLQYEDDRTCLYINIGGPAGMCLANGSLIRMKFFELVNTSLGHDDLLMEHRLPKPTSITSFVNLSDEANLYMLMYDGK